MNLNIKKSSLIIIFSIFSFLLNAQQLYKADALASFYAEAFHGKKTSNGERYNMNDLTCANKTLPFDTILKVTNLENGRSVNVRVNDRGPFVENRELDLSKGAAIKLDSVKSGVVHVKIEIVKMGPDTKISRDTAAKAKQIMAKRGYKVESAGAAQVKKSETQKKTYAAGKNWEIQVAAFGNRDNAYKEAQKLIKAGFKNVILQRTETVYRVVIKDVPSEKVNSYAEKLSSIGYADCVIRERKR